MPSSRLSFLFGSFKPSEREALLVAANTAPSQFVDALARFLAGWAKSDWLEEYNVERVGEWIGLRCPSNVRQAAVSFAESQLASNNTDHAKSVYVATYQALIKGVEQARLVA
jgi:hypothetical protein